MLDEPGEKLCIKNYGSAIMVEWWDGRMASDALKLRILENVSGRMDGAFNAATAARVA